MEQLINDIYEIVKDYRADEDLPNVKMTKQRLQRWVEQFDEADRVFILTELKAILSKRYCSKENVKTFLKAIVDKLTTDLGYQNVTAFLNETIFLDLQPEGKSQKKLLKLLTELLRSNYNFNIENCGQNAKKQFIYIDDILCTGNTLFQDIKEWCNLSYNDTKTNLEAIKDNATKLICAFVFIHEKNFYKKKSEAIHKIGYNIFPEDKMYRLFEIQNSENNLSSSLDFVYPLAENQPQIVEDYRTKIVEQVNEYTKRYNSISPEEFYRTPGRPQTEILFSSPENRKRFENIMLKKGVEILNRANTRIKNMRALGFSLPSQKNFGFGTLSFTWRNVANNTPLVFWYSGGGFYPLFVKNQTNIL
jgi:hypothetical protein